MARERRRQRLAQRLLLLHLVAVALLGAAGQSDNNSTGSSASKSSNSSVPVTPEQCAFYFQQREPRLSRCRTELDRAAIANSTICPDQCLNLLEGVPRDCVLAVKQSLDQSAFRNPEDQFNDNPFDVCRTSLCDRESTRRCLVTVKAVLVLQPLWLLKNPDNSVWASLNGFPPLNNTPVDSGEGDVNASDLSPSPTPSNMPNDSRGGGLNVGAIVGGVVAGIAVVSVLSFFALRPGNGWLRRPWHAHKESGTPTLMLFSAESGSLPETSSGKPPLAPGLVPPVVTLLSVQTGRDSDSLPVSYVTTGWPTTASASIESLDNDPLLTHISTCLGAIRRGGGAATGAAAGPRQLPADVEQWVMSWDQLTLRRPVGRGSFGRVYLASWNATPVAVKVLLSADEHLNGLELPEPVMTQLLEECQVMARIRHPNVVNFMGLCTLPPCILTEYCSRGSLYDVLPQGASDPQLAAPLTWQRRLEMAYHGARGLLYLHSRGILHRDVKSPNLLVNQSWQIKLCDFNLSSLLRTARQQPDSSEGSGGPTNPRWLPPELLRGEPAVAASDCFSYALCLWELLTWRMPWHGLTPFQIRRYVLDGKRPELPEYDALPGPDKPTPTAFEAYCSLVADCWRQEPEERPALADVVARLEELAGPDVE